MGKIISKSEEWILNKRIISLFVAAGLLFGSASALPQETFIGSYAASSESLTSGDWEYSLLADKTVSLTAYKGKDKAVTIPSKIKGKTVTKLGDALFADNASLESVVVPDTVTAVGGSCFAGCGKLSSVSLPDSVKALGTAEHGFVFSGCKSLAKITLPKDLTVIEQGLFLNCSKLKEIKLPEKITKIGYAAFSGCSGLTVIDIPAAAKDISGYAFDSCAKLSAINVSEKNKSYCSKDGVLYNKDKTRLIRCPAVNSGVMIPSSVYEISGAAFEGNSVMTSVIIPSKVSIIGKAAFRNCRKLKNIYVNSGNKNFSSYDGALYNKDKSEILCYPCAKNSSADIPISVRKIGSEAFYGCTELKNLKLPVYTSEIGSYAFAYSGLTDIEIGSEVKKIDTAAFYSCKALSAVTLAKGVETVGSMAFENCTALKSIYIPSSVKSIGSNAFGTYKTSSSASSRIKGFVVYGEETGKAAKKYAESQKLTYKAAPAYSRLAGATRYDTACAISKETFKKADTVILAYGLNYADALAGVPLASAYNAPILLTAKESLPDETLSEIQRLGAKQIIILGGEGAVGTEIEQELQKNGFTEKMIKRIAGKTRFETAEKIAQELESVSGNAPSEVFIVYYDSYADALSASTAAAIKGAPVLYAAKEGTLNESTASYLTKTAGGVSKAYVIGGEGAISAEMMGLADKALGGAKTERIFGANRYKTCIAVNERFKDMLTGKSICTAKGSNFPDALAGGVYAAKNKVPLFLADGTLSAEQEEYLKSRKADSLSALGGVGAVSERLVQQISTASIG